MALPWPEVGRLFRLECSDRIARCPQFPRLVFSARASERVDPRTKLHVNQCSAPDHRLPSCTRQGTGNSTGPQVDVTERALRNRLLDTHIGDHHPAARPKDAGHLTTSAELVRAKVEHAIADHHVCPTIFDRRLLDIALAELDVVKSELLRQMTAALDHLGRHVDADDPTLFPDT